MRKSYLMLGSLGVLLFGTMVACSPAKAADPAATTPTTPTQNIREYVPSQRGDHGNSWNNHRQGDRDSIRHREWARNHKRQHKDCNECGKDGNCGCNGCDKNGCGNNCGDKRDGCNECSQHGQDGRHGSQCGQGRN